MNVLLAFLTSLTIASVSGIWIVPWLRKLKFGATILEDGPAWHASKQGTPIMGGLIFILSTTVATLLFSIPDMSRGDLTSLLILFPALAFGGIGAFDDLVKVTKKRNKGLTALQKFLLQLVVSALFLAGMHLAGLSDGKLPIPFTGFTAELPWILFLILGIVFITGTDNATNLTDGVDGLLAGMTLPIMVFFALAGFFLRFGDGRGALAVPAAALAGGLIGFLIYNFHPAKVFMGDTGSLFIGGFFAALGFAAGNPLILVITGLLYYWETLSVMLQVGYFKISHGKRIFKMAPFHHHLEKSGWSEIKIFIVFTLITALLSAAAWFAV